jgi:hypothetical protein
MSTLPPRRKENRKTFLDASLVPLEHALTYRAGFLDDMNEDSRQAGNGIDAFKQRLANELREIAEELHYW